MKCEKCGKELEHIDINMFDRDGSDDLDSHCFQECEENAVVIDTNSAWAGYELSDEERLETVKCPHCGQFPFKNTEIQVHEIVRLVMFRRSDEDVK